MRCLSCNQNVNWRRPIVYIGYNRAIHVDEFVEYMKTHRFLSMEMRKDEVQSERGRGEGSATGDDGGDS